MTWMLSYRGKTQSLDQWHVFHLRRHVQNQGRDTVTFQTDRPQFECDETLEILHHEQRWFCGKLTHTPTFLSAQKTVYTYTVSGPIWYLEHLIFQQPWNYFCDGLSDQTVQVNRSLCLLGQDEKGQAMDTKHCLQALVSYAKEHGAPIALGQVQGFDFYFPCETVKDCSCAEVLQRLLRWTPDAVVWFDYGQPVPSLNLVRQAHLPSKTLPLNSLSRFALHPRPDLKVSAVVLKYEHTHSSQQGSWKTNTIDAYPEHCTGEELNALVLTLELEGTRTHLQEQWVQVQPLQTDSIAWWQQHFPLLKHVEPGSIQIHSVQRSTQLPNELVEGAIAPWMHCETAYDTISASISYATADTQVQNRFFSIKVCATQAVSKIYRHLSFLSEGVKPPQGLAQVLYNSMSCLQYEGEVQWESAELLESHLGKTLCFSDGDASWESLKLPVQEEIFTVDTGQVQLKFGAPRQLGPNDLYQLMRTNRLRHLPEDTNARFAQKCSGNTRTYFPHMTPMVDTLTGHGHYTKLTLGDGQRQIVLDTQGLPPHTQITLKPYDIVENGQLKKIWLLSS